MMTVSPVGWLVGSCLCRGQVSRSDKPTELFFHSFKAETVNGFTQCFNLLKDERPLVVATALALLSLSQAPSTSLSGYVHPFLTASLATLGPAMSTQRPPLMVSGQDHAGLNRGEVLSRLFHPWINLPLEFPCPGDELWINIPQHGLWNLFTQTFLNVGFC